MQWWTRLRVRRLAKTVSRAEYKWSHQHVAEAPLARVPVVLRVPMDEASLNTDPAHSSKLPPGNADADAVRREVQSHARRRGRRG